MNEIYLYAGIAFGVGLFLGVLITRLLAKAHFNKQIQITKDSAFQQYTILDKEYASSKATAAAQLAAAAFSEEVLKSNIQSLQKKTDEKEQEITSFNLQLATANANHHAVNETLSIKLQEIEQLKKEATEIRKEWELNNRQLATAEADNRSLQQYLQTQKQEIEKLNEKFTIEFENIANKILETKSEKFTEINRANLKAILDPLGENITTFKKQVDEVYKAESKERFSLGEKVKELALLNQVISEEAKNLTKALKGESKTQGRWGEVILETILQKSGLRKGEEYFMEYQLFDAEGKALRSEAEGKKMRPDALVMYPDNRHIIIDSKVSLNAFVRLIESDDVQQQKRDLEAHVAAIKGHINELSRKAYDDYDKTLDFVMMFIPNEPAYITAMQGEPDLWNYAYERRVLLISPTNLIASLKLMVDLWKREYQNQNAQAIAERGAKMYDKFVSFVDRLTEVGKYLDKASDSYEDAFKRLNSGNDNLISQASKLRTLGIKNKKELSGNMVDLAAQNDRQLHDDAD